MPDIPNGNTNPQYICANKCPELDRFYMPHCKSTDPNSEKCPCNNHPVWIPLEECDNE